MAMYGIVVGKVKRFLTHLININHAARHVIWAIDGHGDFSTTFPRQSDSRLWTRLCYSD